MQQFIRKALTLGAVFAGLSIAGAGTAAADADVRPAEVAPIPADWPFDDLDDLDDIIWPHVQIPSGFVQFDDDWYDDWYDD